MNERLSVTIRKGLILGILYIFINVYYKQVDILAIRNL